MHSNPNLKTDTVCLGHKFVHFLLPHLRLPLISRLLSRGGTTNSHCYKYWLKLQMKPLHSFSFYLLWRKENSSFYIFRCFLTWTCMGNSTSKNGYFRKKLPFQSLFFRILNWNQFKKGQIWEMGSKIICKNKRTCYSSVNDDHLCSSIYEYFLFNYCQNTNNCWICQKIQENKKSIKGKSIVKNKKYLFKTSVPKEISLIIVIRLLKLLPKIFYSVGFFKTIFTTFFAILKNLLSF